MPSLITTRLNEGAYAVTDDGGLIRDPENLFITKRQSIIFRGSQEQLIAAFKIGTGLREGNSPVSGSKMLCAGPTSMTMVRGTNTGNPRDLHWQAEIEWVGISRAYYGTENFVYRIERQFGKVDEEFPKTYRKVGDQNEYVYYLPSPFTSGNGINPLTGGPKRCRIISPLPMAKVIGVMVTGDQPLGWGDSRLGPVITALKTPEGLTKWWNNGQNGIGGAQPYVPDPIWTYADKYLMVTGDTGGGWVPSSLGVRRQLSVGNLFAFTLDLTYEQRVQPG